MAESNATQVILTDDGLKIIKAQNTADNATSGVNDLNDPNLMSVIEKQHLKIQMDNFATIYTADKDIATSEGIDFSAYDAAYHAYLTYMTPLVADMTTYSPIVRATFNSMVTAVQAEQKRFNAATQAQYNQQIDKAQTDISDGQTKYKDLLSEARSMESSVAGISYAADRAISSAGFASNAASAASQGASSALSSAMSAESNASLAVSTANSTASAFGPVKQNADSALNTALNAQTDASSAVSQALSAASDSKDAKQIAGAVSQSYKTLTDGSTMTIAELQNGLAVKLTKADLDGYATQDWSQNQINTTANGINETISSVKSTVNGQATSINDLKADSNGFRDQFTKVNNTINQHTTDIGTLQADSKRLFSNFDSLNTDNGTNKHDISQLQQTANSFSSTLETVQTQVQNSAVGANLIVQSDLKNGYLDETGGEHDTSVDFYSDNYIATNGATVFTFSSPDYVFKGSGDDRLLMYDSNKNCLGYQSLTSATQTLSKSNVAYIKFSINFTDEGGSGNLSDWLSTHRYKLEKGSVATDFSLNPADTATVTAVSSLSQTVGGFKTDISKKLEQKDLNGYATQDWAQNQINTTADGINGTISSIKSTVDSHTTSINDFQSDSEKFKAQFTKVNGTLDKQSTDIGTLQADSKRLFSNFDSLSSDSKTNQHDIGQLQASAKEFNSTLETVQTQVQNSAVGTNLAIGTNQEYAMGFGIPTTTWKDGYAYEALPTTVINGEILPQDPHTFYYTLIQGTTYTQTIWFETDANVKDLSAAQITWFTYAGHDVQPAIVQNLGQNSYKLVSTYTWPGKSDNNVRLFDISNLNSAFDLTTGTYLKFGKLKLEKGSLSTAWCLNPAENATVTAVSEISQKIGGIQTTVSDKVSSSQLTQLSNQLTGKIEDLSSSTASSFRQTASDISGMVKKGDVVNQFNIDAGGALLSTSGNSTKIVFSSPNIIFDSANPVQIPNANIPGKLTGKTFEAGTITATTKITGADIEAPLVHSPSGSFKLDGNTGDIVGASIHSADNSWGIDKDGNINGVNIVANTFNTNNGTFKVDSNGAVVAKNMTLTGGTLTSPTINASTINGSTINGTTFNAGTQLNSYGNTSYPLTINSDGSVTSTSFGNIANDPAALRTVMKDGTVKTNFRGMNKISNGIYSAADIAMGAGQLALFEGYTKSQDPNFTATDITPTGYVILDASTGLNLHGDNQQITFNGTSADVTPKGIIITPYGNINPNGTQNIWYVGNGPTMKTASFGIDGSGANNIQFNRSLDIGNFNINTYHTITSSDNGPIHFNRANGSSVDIYAATVHYESLSKVSLLSVKKDVKKADTAYWAQLVNSIDLATYQYKSDDNTSNIRLSSIVDDVNDTKQWQLPDIFISRDEDGKLCGVDDSVLLNATLATVQEQQKQIDQLNGHNMELEARLNKLEAKLNG